MAKGSVTQAFHKALHQLLWVYSRWLLLIAIMAYALTGIYKIERDAVGVLSRFGRVIQPNILPGLHYKLPWPIDLVESVPVKQIKTMVIRDFGSSFTLKKEGGISYEFYKETNLEPYCITGDNNIVAITLVIKYTIVDPVKYLFGMNRPEIFIERSAANLIIRQLAHLPIDDVLTHGKKQLEFNLQNLLIEELERYDTGIRVSFLEIKEISPPTKVQDDFDRVINAEVEKKRALHQAQGFLNRIVPEARSEADKYIQEATAYREEKILTAEGEASRFLSRLKGFKKDPKAQQEKIYLEFVKKVYPMLKEIRVVDGRGENGPNWMNLK